MELTLEEERAIDACALGGIRLVDGGAVGGRVHWCLVSHVKERKTERVGGRTRCCFIAGKKLLVTQSRI